jgi:hypothetical protein
MGRRCWCLLQALNLAKYVDFFGKSKPQTWRPFVLDGYGRRRFCSGARCFDTALSARISVLAKGCRITPSPMCTQMGKLHIGLGLMTYVLGQSLLVPVSTVIKPTGNKPSGVAMAKLRPGNHVDGWFRWFAGKQFVWTSVIRSRDGYRIYGQARSRQNRRMGRSGVRLSSVFSVNLVGALFTALELGGNYLYNHYNTSAHDQWLQSTPWGRDASKRKSLSLADYQNALIAIMQAPSVQVGPVEHDTWWKDLLLEAKVGDMLCCCPGWISAHLRHRWAAGPAIS